MINPSERVGKIFANIEASESIKTKPDALVLGNGTEPHLDASFFYITGFPYGLFEGSYIVAREGRFGSNFSPPHLKKRLQGRTQTESRFRLSQEKMLFQSSVNLQANDIMSIGINSTELTVKTFDVIKSAFKTCADCRCQRRI